MKDMIISGGRNIYSVEVENALAAHPAVAEIAIVSRKHEEYGETVVAVVNPMSGQTISLDELREFGAGRLSAISCRGNSSYALFRGPRPGRCSSTCYAPTSKSTARTKRNRQAGRKWPSATSSSGRHAKVPNAKVQAKANYPLTGERNSRATAKQSFAPETPGLLT
jgi:acyl-CoA synthetase (AMP-forming)/AMP-acid ligase II